MTHPRKLSPNTERGATVSATAVSISTGLSVRSVTMTFEATARRRADLPDVWTAEVELGNGKMLRQHFRDADGGDGMEDVTDLVAEILLDRSRATKAAEHTRQTAQVARVGLVTPERLRRDRGGVVIEGTMKAGQTRGRALTSLGTLDQRNLLTMRQAEAGDRLAQDVKVTLGAKEARDDAAPLLGLADPNSGRDWEDFAAAAGRRVELAKQACAGLPWFEGMSPWTAVQDIVLHERTLTEAAGSHARTVLRRYKAALRIGLDAVADAYRLPVTVTRTHVLSADGIPMPLTLTEDRDGPDQDGNVRRVYRAISLDGKPWVALADSMSDLYATAKVRLRAVVEQQF